MEKRVFTEFLRSDRVALVQRKVDIKQSVIVSDLVNRNKEFLSPWLGWAVGTYTPEDDMNYSKECEEKWNNMTDANYRIFNIKTQEIMGGMDIRQIDYDVGKAEIGYYLGQEFTGCGYMTEAVGLLEDEFFRRGIHRIEIFCDSLNTASIRVAERTGHKLEGVLRQNDWNTFHTELRDTCIYSKLRSEWNG